MTKSEIRSELKKRRNSLSAAQQSSQSSSIRNRLLQTEAYQSCIRVFTYVSFQSEVDTTEIIRQAIRDGKMVYVPKVESPGLAFYELQSLEGLVPSKFGVLEPFGLEETKFRFENQDSFSERQYSSDRNRYKNLMLLPGLAFDPYGNRIGYGAGYYDRYLASCPASAFYKIALAYDFQVLEEIPADKCDMKVGEILTPSGSIFVS